MCIIDEFGFKKEHQFSTLTSDLLLLRDTLVDSEVRYVAMESTSIYWIFIWRLLVDSFDVKFVNLLFIKQLSGHKNRYQRRALDRHRINERFGLWQLCPFTSYQSLHQYERYYSLLNKKIVDCEQFIEM